MDSEQNSIQQLSPAPSEDSDVGLCLPDVPKESGPQTVSLAVLMDFAIQQTLYELTILSEMLPIKDHTERKKAIVRFAHATRLMFVKLLSIVRWLRQSKKFEPLSSICYVLDQQAQCFIETADKLCELARVELQHARLPLFQVSTAIDVLTSGTYPRLPMVIKDAFIPQEKLTPFETRQTLLLLNEKLVFYLTKAVNTLPNRVSVFKIHNGTIIMRVTGEFQVRMTVLPRKKPEVLVLSVAILIQDYDVGGGLDLVHPLQLNTIHETLQSRVAFHPEPFLEAYKFLHHFCMGLQLDVYECQTRKLMTDIAPNYVRVEAYDPYEGYLIIRYWINERSQPSQTTQSIQPRSSKLLSTGTVYRMKLYIDREDIDVGLRIRHSPPSAVKLLDRISTDRPYTMGALLNWVINVRIRERLALIRQILLQVPPKVPVPLTGDAASTVTYELLVHEQKSHPDEHLVVSVNAFYGHIVCQVPCLEQNEELKILEKELNGSCLLSEVEKSITRLRVSLMVNRYRNAAAVSQVKLITEAQLPILMTLKDLPKDRLMMQFTREPNHFLVVTFEPSKTMGISIRFRMVTRTPETNKLNSVEIDPISIISETPVPAFYQHVYTGDENNDPGTMECKPQLVKETVLDAMENNCVKLLEPRKRSPWVGTEDQVKTVIAAIEDRLAFLRIADELDKRGIKHDPVIIDPVMGGPVLRITDMRKLGSSDCEDFFDTIVSASIRIDSRRNIYWPFEYTLRDPPLVPNFYQNRAMGKLKIIPANTLIAKMVQYENKRIGANQTIRCFIQEISTAVKETIGESVASSIVERAATYSHLYGPVKRFSRVYHHYQKVVDVVCYNYQKLILAYGTRRSFTVTLSWKPQPTNSHFTINFGQFFYPGCDDTEDNDYQKRINPHHLIQHHLIEKFNKDRDLIGVVETLVNTTLSVYCLSQLSRHRIRPSRVPSGIETQPNYAVEYPLYIYANGIETVRIIVGPVHLEVGLLTKNSVAIRDVTPEKPLARGFHSFIAAYKNQVFNEDDFTDFKEELEAGQDDTTVPDEFRPPASLQVNPHPPSEIPNPRSVPENFIAARSTNEDDDPMTPESPPSRAPILLNCRQLMRICTDLDQRGIPLLNYLTTLMETVGNQILI